MLQIGTSGFQYPEWRGTFYPPDMPAAKMLAFYATHFSTTESNYTFRRMPKPSTLERWAELTPDHFRFSLKAPQQITHFAKLQKCEDATRFFCDTAVVLQRKLGTILFQLPPGFKKDIPILEAFLITLPPGLRVAFEFRHRSWLDDDVYAALHRANAALCIARSEDLATPVIATADHGYLRLREVQYSPEDLQGWADAIAEQSQWRDVFVYFKHEEAGTGPEFAKALISLCGAGKVES
jgi:uncharacterized protein YecE (DUF72 family)